MRVCSARCILSSLLLMRVLGRRYSPSFLQGWGGWVSRVSQDYGVRYMFPPRLRRGTRHPDAPLPPCFAAEERPCDTLRALPENVAAPRGSRWAHLYATSGGCVEVSVASVVTSGCPKRSEGGCPCRSEEGAEPRANPAGWFVVWACAPCLANWCGGGLSPFSVLLGDLAFCMWRGGNMRRGSLHPHAMSHRVSECNPGESLA